MECHGDGSRDLNRCSADLAVALSEVQVADPEQRGRHGDARQLSGPRDIVVDLPLDEKRLGEAVREKAESGDHRGDSEVGGAVPEELDLEHVPRLRTDPLHRARERMPEAEVELRAVGVRARPRQLPGQAVLRLEGHRVTGGDRDGQSDVRMPAVVHQRSLAMRSAAAVHAATSASGPDRGLPTWCSGTIAADRPPATTGVAIWAA